MKRKIKFCQTVLIAMLPLFGFAQLTHSGSSGFCQNCNRESQGKGHQGMLGMLVNGNWSSALANPQSGRIVAHYFLPFLCGAVSTPVFEWADSDLSVTAFPNPVTDYLILQWEGSPPRDIHVGIYNMMGHKIRELHWLPRGQRMQWNLSDLSSGSYLLSLRTADKSASQVIQIVH